MNRAFRIIRLVFLVIAILLCLAIPASALISTLISWHGLCSGFTDGQTVCSWWEFARNELFWASFLFIPFLFLASLVWLGMSLAQFIQLQVDRRRRKRQP
jgi:predicted membrane protein